MNRRTALIGAGGAVAVAAAGASGYTLWSGTSEAAWRKAVQAMRAPIDPALSGPEALLELVRCATLAANSHNTQAWRFTMADQAIVLEPDFARRTPIVDPDDHHLYVSLGAAAENIVQAAPVLGLLPDLQFDPEGDGRIVIALSRAAPAMSAMAEAIPNRQCTRSLYDGRPISGPELEQLAAAARGDGIELMVLTDRPAIDGVGALVIDGDTAQMGDRACIDELKHWLRFSYSAAEASGDGLFSATTGNPVVPGPIGRVLFDFVATAESENTKYRAQIASSAGLAVFVSAQSDKAHWVAAGRAYQRFALLSTALGIKHAFLNQAVEVPAVRQRLAEHLGLGERRPDLIVRFGYADAMPSSMRRPLADVIV